MAAHGCFKLSVYVYIKIKINAYPNATDVAVRGGGTKNFSYFLRGYEKYLLHFHGV